MEVEQCAITTLDFDISFAVSLFETGNLQSLLDLLKFALGCNFMMGFNLKRLEKIKKICYF